MRNRWLLTSMLQRRLWLWLVIALLLMLLTQYGLLWWSVKHRQQIMGEEFLTNVAQTLNTYIAQDGLQAALQDNRFIIVMPSMLTDYSLMVFLPDGKTLMIYNDRLSKEARPWTMAGLPQLVGLQRNVVIHHIRGFESWQTLDNGYAMYLRGHYEPVLPFFLAPIYALPIGLALVILLLAMRKLRQRQATLHTVLRHAQQSASLQNSSPQGTAALIQTPKALPLELIDDTELRQLAQFVNRNAFRAQRFRQQVVAMDHKQTYLVDNAPVGLFLMNRRGQVNYFNEHFGQTFGVSFSRDVVYMLSDFVFGKDSLSQQHLTEMVAHPTLVTLPVTNLSGHQNFELTLKPFFNRFDKLAGFSGTLFLVTHYQNQLSDAANLNKQLTDRVGELDKLWAEISHELRTPLAGTLGILELMLGEPAQLTADQSDTLMTVQQSIQVMLQLLNDMLDAAKLNAGKFQTTIDYLNLVELLQQVSGLMTARAKQQNIGLYVFFDPQVPHFIDTDATQLRQILLNLLSNAIKFTQQGYVALLIDSIPYYDDMIQRYKPHDDGRPYWLRIRVKDTGIGIKDHEQHKLFRYFNQANPTISEQFGGTGLGLAISNRFAQMLGGFIHLNSTFGQGSTFTLYLPLGLYSRRPVLSLLPEQLNVYVVILSPYELVNERLTAVFNGLDIASTSFNRLDNTTIAKIRQTNLMGKRLIVVVDEALYEVQELSFDTLAALMNSKKILLSMEKAERIDPKRAAQYDSFLTKPMFLNPLVTEVKALSQADQEASTVSAPSPNVRPQDAFKAFLQQWQSQQTQTDDEINDHQSSQTPNKPNLYRSKTILVAEDNALNQKIIEKHLAILGYPTLIVNNGEEAIEQLETHRNHIGLVLMDCRMPILDGLEASRLIRAKQYSVPIIALTASDTDDDRQLCAQAGMDGFLTKPVNRDLLAQTLQRYILA